MNRFRWNTLTCSMGIVFILVTAVACTPESRYRMLSFVFDGVPPPPGIAPASTAPQTVDPQFKTGLAAIHRGDVAVPEGPSIVSVHEPVREGKCGECHDLSVNLDQMPPSDAQLCDRCHEEQRQEEGWHHGPINIGTCVPCHVPHRSQYTRLLDKPIPDLCLVCHQEDMQRSEDYHNVPNVDECITCHDPHRMY